MSDIAQAIIDDDQPLAVRRKRRSSASNGYSRSNSLTSSTTTRPHGIATPPQTPKRAKKRVRFSDPGPAIEVESASSGLTPFIQKTSLTTPTSKRRQSTPSRLSNRVQYDDAPICGTIQFKPLRMLLDGRAKRRLKRNRLSEEVNIIEIEKRAETKQKRSEIERLKAELAAKNLEVQSMRDEHEIASQIEGESGVSIVTTTTLSAKVQELEQEIRDLKAELQHRESDTGEDPNWTMAARDPFDFDEDDNMITNYDDDFQDTDIITTPTRLNTSFPSPPSTMPNTPCKSTSSVCAGIQASLPDPEKETLKSQLKALQIEISKLTSSVAFNEDHQARLAGKLSDFISADESPDHTVLDSALDTVLTQLALSQSQALESATAFDALSTEISNLGFPASSPDEVLSIIASQFRQARLDLEYLTPGEVTEGFENSKLIAMLVSRLRVLVEKVKKQDDSIDQYHEQELLLRQQIDTRVSVMDDMRRELSLANNVIHDLKVEISEKDIGNDRLKKALDDYRDEVRGLETLVERIEREAQITDENFRSEVADLEKRLSDEVTVHAVTKHNNEGKAQLVAELEKRLFAAQDLASRVQDELNAISSSIQEKDTTISNLQSTAQEREKSHGEALALRDARVSELREEIERINNAFKTAHSTILSLRTENAELVSQVEGEKKRGKFVVAAIQDQLKRALETGVGYVNGDVAVQGPSREVERGMGRREVQSDDEGGVRREAPKQMRLLDGGLARRGSGKGKKRRRYDSGLGFLEEEGEEEMVI